VADYSDAIAAEARMRAIEVAMNSRARFGQTH
jgi:hypothetical protein